MATSFGARAHWKRLVAAITIGGLVAAGATVPVFAAVPSNDNYANANLIAAVPFDTTVNLSEATVEQDEPMPCSYQITQSVWFTFTPASSGAFKATVPQFNASLALYEVDGPAITDLSQVACDIFDSPAAVAAKVTPGKTYALQVGLTYGGASSWPLHVDVVPPPPNDNFADATPISAAPFADSADMALASTEPGEPTDCSYGSPSVWWAFTPAVSGSYTAGMSGDGSGGLGVWQGSSLQSLNLLSCGNGITIHAVAGQTYFYQAALQPFGGNTILSFGLDVTPPPVANFGYYPSDPSTFDTVQFFDNSYDPANAGWTALWTFGDGTTSTDHDPTHLFTADGNYSVELQITTNDGRTATTNQVVTVGTHDVAITRFTVPTSAKAGQTRSLTVGLNSHRYKETVQVDLYRSSPGGFEWIGSQTVTVFVRPANRTTDVAFNYTFTSDDARIGKVSFKAVATIVGARDVLPADNEATSAPVKVAR
jgi:PKD repeat protein